MKKLLSVTLVLAMVLSLTLSLVGCLGGGDKYNAIRAAYEEEKWYENKGGWMYLEMYSTLLPNARQQIETSGVKVCFYQDGGAQVAMIVGFDSEEDLKNAFNGDSIYSEVMTLFMSDAEHTSFDDVYQAAVDKGYVNGNCLLIPVAYSDRVVEIFKNA